LAWLLRLCCCSWSRHSVLRIPTTLMTVKRKSGVGQEHLLFSKLSKPALWTIQKSADCSRGLFHHELLTRFQLVPKLGMSGAAPSLRTLSFACIILAGIAQSVQRFATGWTVRGSNPGGGARFPVPFQTGPEAHPASYIMSTMSLSRG